MHSKNLYANLFAKKWQDPILFVQDAAKYEDHPIWGSGGAGREFAREILKNDAKWAWLGDRIDDFANLIENRMRLKLNKWLFRALLDCGGLSKKLCSTEEASKWLMDRYVAELKNLFDKKYKNSIDIHHVFIEGYEDEKTVSEPTECGNTQLVLFDDPKQDQHENYNTIWGVI